MKSLFIRIWNWFNGKKLWTTITMILGYQLAQLQFMYPDCLPIPAQIPILGGWCVPWDWILPLLAVAGIGIGGGHKLVKRVQQNGAVFLLLALLLAAPVFAQGKVFALPMEKWNGFDGEGKTGASFRIAQQLIDSLADEGLCDGIHLALHTNWAYLGDDPKSLDLRTRTQVLREQIESYGLTYIAGGPALAKHWGPAPRSYIPLSTEARQVASSLQTVTTDGKGYAELGTLKARLNSLPPFTMGRVAVKANLYGGWLYVNHSDGKSHITKMYCPPNAVTRFPFIALPGISVGRVLFRGQAGTSISSISIILHDAVASELDSAGNWVGNDASGFFNCRTLDLADVNGIWETCWAFSQFQQAPLLFVTDELNGPIGWTPNFDKLYPAGWPQAWAAYVERAAFTSFQLTGDTSWFFGTDPRGNTEELRYNRTSKPVPTGATCDYLQYLDPQTPMKLLVWAETNRVSEWASVIEQARQLDSRPVIGIYANGLVSVDSVFAAVADPCEVDWAVFWWNREAPNAFPILRQVRTKLKGT